ncbi:hypothetical protein E2562_003450 [Oryza meyeriana var. granulata]|nr:hypothetical protein E2562_003450 [Oryza meyeriana var. granulata]
MVDERTEAAGASSTGEDTIMASPSASTSRALDPAWAHAEAGGRSKNALTCLHCGKKIGGGGITRFKYHLAGITGQVQACKKVPHDVRRHMKQLVLETRGGRRDSCFEEDSSDAVFSNGGSGIQLRPSRKRRTGYVSPQAAAGFERTTNVSTQAAADFGRTGYVSPQAAAGFGRTTNVSTQAAAGFEPSSGSLLVPQDLVQHSMNGLEVPNDLLHDARVAIARWWYDANIPFSAAKSPFYQPMLDAIASAGVGFKGPLYHDLRGPLLKHLNDDVREYLCDLKKEWSACGCSVIADRQKNHGESSIINFLVYCRRGTMFLKSVDTSAEKANLLEIFDQVVREVGPENIVQFITDPRYKATVKVLEERYKTFVWSPCAARCIDLMLENLANPRYFPMIDEALNKARKITRFIYNHAWVLSLMRKEFTGGRDLCRPAISRFATHFLSLQCILKFEKELRQMVTSNKWVKSTYAKGGVGKEVAAIILDAHFWAQCKHAVKVTEPLSRVLRLVDSNKKPSMGYLYEAMEKAKETIRARMMNKVSLYGPYIRVIDARMEKQLHSPLHAAGCFFNPGIFFSPSFKMQSYAHRGLIKTITCLVPDDEIQDKIFLQLEEYKKSTGDFGLPIAIRQREKVDPVAWWDNFGNGTLELQDLAMRVLGQCCSATGCERNWDIFKYIHSRKINSLEGSRLNDVVFVQYNQKLQERNLHKRRDVIDPISLDNIDVLDEWVSEEPNLLCKDDLNWESIDAPFAEPTSEDEELVAIDEEAPTAPLSWPAAEAVDSYCPPPDQDPYLYVTQEDEVQPF